MARSGLLRLAASAFGERNVVRLAEGILRCFLICEGVLELVVQDQSSGDSSSDDDSDDDQRSSAVVVFGDGSEVSGLVWSEWLTGDDFDPA